MTKMTGMTTPNLKTISMTTSLDSPGAGPAVGPATTGERKLAASGTDGAANGRPRHNENGAAGRGEEARHFGEEGGREAGFPADLICQPSAGSQAAAMTTAANSISATPPERLAWTWSSSTSKRSYVETGSRIEKMPKNNKGYDILVRHANGEPQRYIEVKATEGAWGLRGVGLTEPQFSLARQERERYWLYVVEHLYQPEAHLWWIRDPAGRVDYFHYDYGWRTAAQGQARVTGASAHGVPQSV